MATIEPYATKNGRRYRVRYRTPDRRQTDKRGFKTKRDAHDFAATVEVEKLTGSYVPPSAGRITVGELAPEWITRHSPHWKPSWATRVDSIWRTHLKPRWNRTPIADIRPSDVQAWISGIDRKPSTLADIHAVLAGILDDAAADRRITVNPARQGVRTPPRHEERPKNFLTHAQVRSLADAAKHPTIVWLLATSGLRWGEMAALRPLDLDVGNSHITVARSASKVDNTTVIGAPKSGRPRDVELSPQVMKLVAAEADGKAADELIWQRPRRGGPLRPPTTSHWFGAAVRRCQETDPTFPTISVHELRHTAASILIAEGVDPKELQNHLGHTSAALTMDRYGHLMPHKRGTIGHALDNAFGPL